MTEYRLYWLNDAGHITFAEWIDARSDDEAIVIIRAQKANRKCEIWDRQRHVADVPAFAE